MEKQVIDTNKKIRCKDSMFSPEILEETPQSIIGLVQDKLGGEKIPTRWDIDGTNRVSSSYDLTQEPNAVNFINLFCITNGGSAPLTVSVDGNGLDISRDYHAEIIDTPDGQQLKFYKK